MNRIIVNYDHLNKGLLKVLTETFPNGIDEEDLISFTTPKGERISAVELKTSEGIYLVKHCLKLRERMEDYEIEEIDPPLDLSEIGAQDEEE